MKKLRLLIVTDDANMGGTYKVAERMVFGLRGTFDAQFACLFNAGNEASRAAIAATGVKVHDYQVTEGQLHRSTFATDEAEDLLEATNPELILLFDGAEIWSHLALKDAAKNRAIPYVMVINLLCEDCPDRFTDLRERGLDAIRAAHLVIFVSEAIKRRFEKLFPDVEQRLLAIPNGISSEFFVPQDFRRERSFPEVAEYCRDRNGLPDDSADRATQGTDPLSESTEGNEGAQRHFEHSTRPFRRPYRWQPQGDFRCICPGGHPLRLNGKHYHPGTARRHTCLIGCL